MVRIRKDLFLSAVCHVTRRKASVLYCPLAFGWTQETPLAYQNQITVDNVNRVVCILVMCVTMFCCGVWDSDFCCRMISYECAPLLLSCGLLKHFKVQCVTELIS